MHTFLFQQDIQIVNKANIFMGALFKVAQPNEFLNMIEISFIMITILLIYKAVFYSIQIIYLIPDLLRHTEIVIAKKQQLEFYMGEFAQI